MHNRIPLIKFWKIYIYIYRKKLKSLWKNKNNQKWNNNFTFLFFSFLLIIPLRVSCKRVFFQVKSRLFVASPFPPHPFSFSLFYLQKQSQWSGAQCNFTMQRTMRRINGSYKMDESTRRTAGEDSKQQWSFREWNYWSWGGKKKEQISRMEEHGVRRGYLMLQQVKSVKLCYHLNLRRVRGFLILDP